jgi:hypothetical protein
MSQARERLLQTAHEIGEVNPLLGYELERSLAQYSPKPVSKVAVVENHVKPLDVAVVIAHYANLLCNSTDKGKTTEYLKKLLHVASPLLRANTPDKMRVAAPIVRCAHARPDLRRYLLPVIYQLTGR